MIRIFKHYIPTSLLVLGLLEMGLIFASVYVMLNLASDILSLLANPRRRRPK